MEIKMPYSEFEKMKEQISDHQKLIDDISKHENVVVVVIGEGRLFQYPFQVMEVIANEKLAGEYMAEKLNNLVAENNQLKDKVVSIFQEKEALSVQLSLLRKRHPEKKPTWYDGFRKWMNNLKS